MLKKSVIVFLSLLILVVVILITLIALGKCCFQDNCEIPIAYDRYSPFFIRNGYFYYPSESNTIILSRDERILVGCPGTELNTGATTISATCITEDQFSIRDDNLEISELYCEEPIKSIARYTERKCENNGDEIEVGYDMDNHFITLMRICFDKYQQNTLYTEHNLTNFINNHEISKARPYFVEAGFYNLNGTELYQLYNRKNQRAAINKQLNINDASNTEVIKDGFDFFLSRGHLAPRADFFFSPQQNASFYYINSAPQWGIINSKSWNSLEWRIRSYAATKNYPLKIITGTYGNLVLNKWSTASLYLFYNRYTKGIPIPQVFWKVVFDPADSRAVAFVGTNNPYLLKEDLSLLCNNILPSLQWISINNKNLSNGFIYACEVNDLRNRINFIPQLAISGLLVD